MNYSLLQSWLGLPPGSWPPDHYTLLGLPLGQGEPSAIEPLVLARMELLRPHQLLHPELVTEGMNRLAQALICLTDPVARAAHDADLGLRPTSSGHKPAAIQPLDARYQSATDHPAEAQPPHIVAEIVPFESLPDEVVESHAQPSVRPAYEVVTSAQPSPLLQTYEIVEAELVTKAPLHWGPYDRRQLYRRLAILRRLLAAWRKLQPLLCDSTELFDCPVKVLLLLEAAATIKEAFHTHGELIQSLGQPGLLLRQVLSHQHFLAIMRMLLPDQRRALAADWRRGEQILQREYRRLRRLVRTVRPRRRWGLFRGYEWSRCLLGPEGLVWLVAGFVVVVAVWRALMQR